MNRLLTVVLTVLLSCVQAAAQTPPDTQTLRVFRDALTQAIDALEGGKRIVVRTAAEFQTALDTAKTGQTIALVPGTEYVGTFLLKATTRTDYVTVTTEGLVLPESRVTSPAGMAVIRSATNTPAIQTMAAASYYRFVGLAFGATRGGEDDIIRLGNSQDPDPAHVPHHLQFDRIYMAGTDATGQRRGIAANADFVSVTRSTIENIWKAGQDSQAIAGWSGMRWAFIDDNFLEAASENFLVGGTPPASSSLLPCDITFTNNDLVKRAAWRTLTDRNIKNLFELKFGCRIVVRHNRMSGNWQQAQSGYAIVLTVDTNVSGLPGCPFCALTDVRFEHNEVRNTAAGIQILGSDYSSPSGGLDKLTITYNLFVISRASYGGNGFFLSMEGGPVNVVVEHNTVISDGWSFVNATNGSTWFTGTAPIQAPPPRAFIFRSNVVFSGGDGLWTPTGANGRGIPWFIDAMVEDNVIIGAPTTERLGYPVSNRLVTLADKLTVYDPVTFKVLAAFAAAGR